MGLRSSLFLYAQHELSLLYSQSDVELNPYWSLEEKFKELTKMAENFSYKKAVNNSKKQVKENCTDAIEDLFKKIFTINPIKRINFHEIRQHPVFCKYFPKPSAESVILYTSKFQSKRLSQKSLNGFKNKLA